MMVCNYMTYVLECYVIESGKSCEVNVYVILMGTSTLLWTRWTLSLRRSWAEIYSKH